MRGCARHRDVVERSALVKERGLGEFRYFACASFSSARRRTRSPRPRGSVIGNITRSRKRIVRHRDVPAETRRPAATMSSNRDALIAEMLLDGETLERRVAEAELHLRGRIEAAVGEIAARLGADAACERRSKNCAASSITSVRLRRSPRRTLPRARTCSGMPASAASRSTRSGNEVPSVPRRAAISPTAASIRPRR